MKLSVAVVVLLVAGGIAFPIEDVDLNPEENSGEFEGDIILNESQEIKHGTTNSKQYWPKATMFYKIAPEFGKAEKKNIEKAINEYHTRTCLRIVERTNEKNYVLFKPHKTSCSSSLGMQGGVQKLNLARWCFTDTAGTIVHELMHAFGFWHQHSAPNRDDYVTIHLQNVNDTALGNFKKYNSIDATDFGVSYDYGSIMHYSRKAFSKNNQETITPKDPNAVIGQRKALSQKDILKLHKMYKCKSTHNV